MVIKARRCVAIDGILDTCMFPENKVNVANMGPIRGLQDPGGPYVGPMNFAI